MAAPPKELQREWNARLRDSGFADGESECNPNGPWKVNRYETPVDKDQAEYYDRAREFLRRRGGRLAPRDRRIWRLHAAGLSYTEIGQELGLGRDVAARSVQATRTRMEQSRGRVTHRAQRSPRGRESARVEVRLSDVEATLLERIAELWRVTRPEVLRRLLMGIAVTPSKLAEVAQFVQEIAASDG